MDEKEEKEGRRERERWIIKERERRTEIERKLGDKGEKAG